MSREDVEKELERIREGFEQIIDVTPETVEVDEPDAEGRAEESRGGIVGPDNEWAEDDGQEN